MALVEKSVLIAHSAQQMFDLVDCCEDYPKFLPWCSKADLHFRDENQTVATLHVNYHGIKSHFSTRNIKLAPERMDIGLVNGPFRYLEGSWAFRPLSDSACKVEFRMHYEFSSRLFEKAIGPVFGHIAKTFVEAFVKRAESLYGAENG